MEIRKQGYVRPVALLLTTSMLSPMLVGCGGGGQPDAPAIDRTGARNLPPGVGAPQAQRPGMSTKQKMVMLAGAAALYYMYKKQRDAQGKPVQYYKSESTGRIYYRDPKTKQPVWVTPPQGGIQVPMSEANEYSNYQGYNNSPAGQGFGGYGGSANGRVPVPAPMR